VTDAAGGWHTAEPHGRDVSRRTNWLRAAVLGANDGIVSVAGLVVGVAGASTDRAVLLTAGLAGVVAGALSMGVGEYVSASAQRDTEQAPLRLERGELADDPQAERLRQLRSRYRQCSDGVGDDHRERASRNSADDGPGRAAEPGADRAGER
jgi:hypothetical protein